MLRLHEAEPTSVSAGSANVFDACDVDEETAVRERASSVTSILGPEATAKLRARVDAIYLLRTIRAVLRSLNGGESARVYLMTAPDGASLVEVILPRGRFGIACDPDRAQSSWFSAVIDGPVLRDGPLTDLRLREELAHVIGK